MILNFIYIYLYYLYIKTDCQYYKFISQVVKKNINLYIV